MAPAEVFGEKADGGKDALRTYQARFMEQLFDDCVKMMGVTIVSPPPFPRLLHSRCHTATEAGTICVGVQCCRETMTCLCEYTIFLFLSVSSHIHISLDLPLY
jgi:hypothetical protein